MIKLTQIQIQRVKEGKRRYHEAKRAGAIDEEQLDAESKERQITWKINNEQLLPEQRQALQEYRIYLNDVKGVKLSSQVTVFSQLGLIAEHIKKSFTSINRSDIIHYIDFCRRKKKFSESTIASRMTQLKGILKWLKKTLIAKVEEELRTRVEQEKNKEIIRNLEKERDEIVNRILRNYENTLPDDLFKELRIKPPNINEYERFTEEDILTAEDILKMIDCCSNTRDKCFIAMLYDGGFRVHEALNMKLRDVEQVGEYFMAHVPKICKTGQRYVDLKRCSPFLKVWLNDHEYKHNREAPLFYNMSKSGRGRQLKYGGASAIIQNSAKQAEINKKVSTHLFRHSRTTIDKVNGAKDDDIRIRAGWTKGSIMLQRYSHISSKDKALEKLGKKKRDFGKIEHKICANCSKNQPATSLYCECGGLLISKEEHGKDERRRMAEEMFKEISKTKEGRKILVEVREKILEVNKK